MSPVAPTPASLPTHPDVVAVDENEYNFELEYRDIYSHINTFQVTINDPDTFIRRHRSFHARSTTSRNSDSRASGTSDDELLRSITVFKKKNPRHMVSGSNIYKQDTSCYELDLNDSTKSKSSCVRCRKFKKKCTRTLPECSNCVSSEELCVYLSRKTKKRQPEVPASTVSASAVDLSTSTSMSTSTTTSLTTSTSASTLPPEPYLVVPTGYFDPMGHLHFHGIPPTNAYQPTPVTLAPSTSSVTSSSNRSSVHLVRLPSINNVLDTILPSSRVSPDFLNQNVAMPTQASNAYHGPALATNMYAAVDTLTQHPPLFTAVSSPAVTSDNPTIRLNQPVVEKRRSLPNIPVRKSKKPKSGDLNNLLN